MARLFTTTALLLLSSLASAAQLTVSIPASQILPNPSSLPATTHAVLLGPPGVRYDVPLRRDNTFIFPDISEASYLLTLHSRDYVFPPLRVDVTPSSSDEGTSPPSEPHQLVSAWQTFRGNEWSNKGPSFGSARDALNIQISPAAQKDFYQARAGFSLLGFLKSPMILMGVVSVMMIFGLPYIMENMDPETRAEFEEMQSKGPIMGANGSVTQLQNFDLASWMAGSSSNAAPKAEPQAPPAPAQSGRSNGGSRKR